MNPLIDAITVIVETAVAEARKFLWTWTVMHDGAEAAERWRDR